MTTLDILLYARRHTRHIADARLRALCFERITAVLTGTYRVAAERRKAA